MNKTKSDPISESIKNFFSQLKSYVKSHWSVLVLIFVGFVAVSVENFFKVAMSQTVFSYSMDDFEVGQIADRTIYAPKSIPAESINSSICSFVGITHSAPFFVVIRLPAAFAKVSILVRRSWVKFL